MTSDIKRTKSIEKAVNYLTGAQRDKLIEHFRSASYRSLYPHTHTHINKFKWNVKLWTKIETKLETEINCQWIGVQSTDIDLNDFIFLTVYRIYFRYLLIFQVMSYWVPSRNAHWRYININSLAVFRIAFFVGRLRNR